MGEFLGRAPFRLLLHRPSLGFLLALGGFRQGFFLGPLAQLLSLALGRCRRLLAFAPGALQLRLGRLLFLLAALCLAGGGFFRRGALLLFPALALQLRQLFPFGLARGPVRLRARRRCRPGALVLRRALRLFRLFAAPLFGLASRDLGRRLAFLFGQCGFLAGRFQLCQAGGFLLCLLGGFPRQGFLPGLFRRAGFRLG